MIKNKKIKKDNFLKKHKEDIEKIAEKYRQKREKAENMIQERKKEENVVTYHFQPQVNKKYNDKIIQKVFHKRQEEFLEKKKQKIQNLKDELQRKQEEKKPTFKPEITNNTDNLNKVRAMFEKHSNDSILKKIESNNTKTYKKMYTDHYLQKQNKLTTKKHTSPTNAVNYCHKHMNNTFNNKTSYVDKYFDFNKNNSNAKKDNDVFSRLYDDAKDRKVRLKKLADTIYRKNANIYNKTQNKNLRNFNQNPCKRK